MAQNELIHKHTNTKNKTQAYIKAEEKYFNYSEADIVSTGYAKTLGHEVEKA
jgi:hypothetical protein